LCRKNHDLWVALAVCSVSDDLWLQNGACIPFWNSLGFETGLFLSKEGIVSREKGHLPGADAPVTRTACGLLFL
jgi:hypothetical protein